MRPVALAGSELTNVRHVCALFHNDEEEYRVLLPFMRDGFEHGERAVHVVSPDQRTDHLQRLSHAGIDAADALRRGQLELRTSTETYLRNGQFDPERMLAFFEQLANSEAGQDVPLSRFVCRMHWAAESRTQVEKLIAFESSVNNVWCRNDHVVVCAYRLDQFSGGAIIDIVRTHPYVIIGGILRQNPFFVPPEQFLPELRARPTARVTRRAGV